MLLIVKKFEASAAYRIEKQGLDKAYTGTNLDILAGYSGPVDPVLGMIVNMNDIKAVVSGLLAPYDHACISPELAFTKESLLEHVLERLWVTLSDAGMEAGKLAYLQVRESSGIRLERGRWGKRGGRKAFFFDDRQGSLANPVMAERISPQGIPAFAASDLPGVTFGTIAQKSAEIGLTKGEKLIWTVYGGALEICFSGDEVLLTAYESFDKAHALGNSTLSDEENERIFGPCSEQHGHRYRFGLTMRAEPEAFETSLEQLREAVRDMFEFLHQAQDLDIPVMTGENIISLMKSRAYKRLGEKLSTVMLQETNSIFFLDADERWAGL